MIYAINEGVTTSKAPHNKFHSEVTKILKELQSKLEVMEVPSGFMGMEKGNVLGNIERFQKSIELAFKKVSVAASNYTISINTSDLSLKDASKTCKTLVADVIKSCGYTEKTKRTVGDKLMGHRYMYKKLDNNIVAVCDYGINSTFYPESGTHNSNISIKFKCCDMTDKTKKALGLKEETILRGKEADSFLESNNIIIYNDYISINGNKMDGFEAQTKLAENGIILNDDHIVLEGKYAEDYNVNNKSIVFKYADLN